MGRSRVGRLQDQTVLKWRIYEHEEIDVRCKEKCTNDVLSLATWKAAQGVPVSTYAVLITAAAMAGVHVPSNSSPDSTVQGVQFDIF
jgi:hypothetical protein